MDKKMFGKIVITLCLLCSSAMAQTIQLNTGVGCRVDTDDIKKVTYTIGKYWNPFGGSYLNVFLKDGRIKTYTYTSNTALMNDVSILNELIR